MATPIEVNDSSTSQVNSGGDPLGVNGNINPIVSTPSARIPHTYSPPHSHELIQAYVRLEILENRIRDLEHKTKPNQDQDPSADCPRWKYELWKLKMYFLIARESIGIALKWVGSGGRRQRGAGGGSSAAAAGRQRSA